MQLASRNHQKADLAKLTGEIEATFADAREALQAVLSTHTN
jgi:hypothetical protein